jgi:hypothetical protein
VSEGIAPAPPSPGSAPLARRGGGRRAACAARGRGTGAGGREGGGGSGRGVGCRGGGTGGSGPSPDLRGGREAASRGLVVRCGSGGEGIASAPTSPGGAPLARRGAGHRRWRPGRGRWQWSRCRVPRRRDRGIGTLARSAWRAGGRIAGSRGPLRLGRRRDCAGCAVAGRRAACAARAWGRRLCGAWVRTALARRAGIGDEGAPPPPRAARLPRRFSTRMKGRGTVRGRMA